MFCSLVQLNTLKYASRVLHAVGIVPLLLVYSPVTASAQPQKATQPKPSARPSTPKPATLVLGLVDEEALRRTRSDFPTLSIKVLPQVASSHHLSLIVARQGFRWGQTALPSVDVTPDVLALLKNQPLTPGALTGEQQKAARQTLDALSALDVALRLGNLKYDAYNERLTNTTILVQASIKPVPEGTLKTQLLQALQSFLDVRTAWDASTLAIVQGDKAAQNSVDSIRALLGEFYFSEHHAQYEKEAEDKRAQVRIDAAYPVTAARNQASLDVETADKTLSALLQG